jgi:penicillin G amidase
MTIHLRGQGDIRIERAAGGVRHAVVGSEADLYYALGWVHGTDRGLQLVVTRILGQGRAAECLQGTAEMVEVDRFFRRNGFAHGLENQLGLLSAHHQSLLEWYVAGVNCAFEHGLPWELRLLGVKPAPWAPSDCLLMARIVGYVSLAQSQGDLERLLTQMVREGVDTGLLDELFPGIAADADPELLGRVALPRPAVPAGVRFHCPVPRMMASNNWVVSGDRTASGAALLCNDPHLEINRLPAVWCEFSVELGDRWSVSAGMPGLPALLIGRHSELAWGATYAFADAEDSWIEECQDGACRRDVDGETRWEPLQVRRETIQVKGGTPVEAVFYENEHGVLEGDPNTAGLYLATRWAAGRGGAKSLAAGFGIWNAKEVDEGAACLGEIEAAFSWVLADTKGRIGYQMSGSIPRRSSATGLLPVAGWDASNDWDGTLAVEELPRCFDPECGFIVTANNDLNHLGTGSPINACMGEARAGRIAELLGARRDWDVEAMRELHMDLVSGHARPFMEVLRPLLPDSEQGRLLSSWDLSYTAESQGAFLFEAWYAGLLRAVFGTAWGDAVHDHLSQASTLFIDFYAHFDRVLLNPDSAWFGERGQEETFRAVIRECLQVAPQPWGQGREVVLAHMVLGGKVPRFFGFDRGPIVLPGGRGTIYQGQIYRDGDRLTTFAPSIRITADMGKNVVHTALCGGPTDRRFSADYVADLEMWLRGGTKTLGPGAR